MAALGPLLERPCLVAGKSTVPVGTAGGWPRSWPTTTRVPSSHEPGFLREGTRWQTPVAGQIVAGVTSQRAEELLRQVYADPIAGGASFFATDLETAELAKTAANAFLATKISFINAMAEICEATGGNVRALAQILGADPRIGSAFLRAGLGFGGGCLPKDVRAFTARAQDLGIGDAVAFLREVDAINLRRRARAADLTLELAGGNLAGVPVCVLGAAFETRVRRCPRLPGPGRGADPDRHGGIRHRLRPGGAGERPPSPP